MLELFSNYPILVMYVAALLVMTPVTFLAYGWDKRRAQLDEYRVPEKTLHLFAFFGGWIGALIGQRRFRHKTKKLSFRIVLWVIVAMHIFLIVAWIYAKLTG